MDSDAGSYVPSRRQVLNTCIAIAALWVAAVAWVAIKWQEEDPVRNSARRQGQRECQRERQLNLVPGESHDDCVERWIRMLWR